MTDNIDNHDTDGIKYGRPELVSSNNLSRMFQIDDRWILRLSAFWNPRDKERYIYGVHLLDSRRGVFDGDFDAGMFKTIAEQRRCAILLLKTYFDSRDPNVTSIIRQLGAQE